MHSDQLYVQGFRLSLLRVIKYLMPLNLRLYLEDQADRLAWVVQSAAYV